MGLTSRMIRIFSNNRGEGEWKTGNLSLRRLSFPLKDRISRGVSRGGGGSSVDIIMSSINSHRETLTTLAERQNVLETLKSEIERSISDKLNAGDRLGALQALKRKKLLDREIFQLDNARLRLESMIFSIESALTQQQTFGALNDLSGCYKNVVKQCNPDKIERLLEEVEINQLAQNRMAELIQINNNNMTTTTTSDHIMTDKDLDTELMEYEIREFDRKVSVLENLPTSVPTLSYEITEVMSSPIYELTSEDYTANNRTINNRTPHAVGHVVG